MLRSLGSKARQLTALQIGSTIGKNDGRGTTLKRLKNRIALALCLALALGLAPAAAAAEPQQKETVFSDVAEDAWYAASIAAMTARGLLTGVSDDCFSPDAPVTRAMTVAALFRLAGRPDAPQSPFSDASNGNWYDPAVNWAWEAGIAAGVAPGRFAPDRPCTVQETVVFLYRYARYTGYPDPAPDVSDSSASPWAAEAVAWASNIGLTPAGAIPSDTVTRGAFAAMLDAYCQFAEPIPDRTPESAVSTPAEGSDSWFAPAPEPVIPGAGSSIPGAGSDIPGAGSDIPGAGPDDPWLQPDFPIQDDGNAGREITGRAVVSYAQTFVENPYQWGGNSLTEGVDAAGFVVLVYEAFGIDLFGYRNSAALRSAGVGVDFGSMQEGDIVCYNGHVAIYAGGGLIVEAQSTSAGITTNRSVTCAPIITIRRVI